MLNLDDKSSFVSSKQMSSANYKTYININFYFIILQKRYKIMTVDVKKFIKKIACSFISTKLLCLKTWVKSAWKNSTTTTFKIYLKTKMTEMSIFFSFFFLEIVIRFRIMFEWAIIKLRKIPSIEKQEKN